MKGATDEEEGRGKPRRQSVWKTRFFPVQDSKLRLVKL